MLLFNCNERCSHYQNYDCPILRLLLNFGLFKSWTSTIRNLNLLPVHTLDLNVCQTISQKSFMEQHLGPASVHNHNHNS